MAGLQDTIAQNKKKLVRGPGGVLSEETPENIQTLAGQAGLPTTPTDHASAAVIGANKDQQKMVGTPAQVTKAMSIAQDPSQNLATAERQRQARTEATEAEAAQQQKSQNLKELGGLGDRVNDFINVQREKLASTAGQATAQVVDTYQGPSGVEQNLSSTKDLLQQLRSNPKDMNLMLQVNQALGYDINRQLSPQEIDSLYQDSVSAISQAGAETMDNSLTVKDLVANPQFGYTPDQLSELLGVPRESVEGMNLGQIKQAVDKMQQEEFSKSSQLQQQAGSTLLGSAERKTAQQLGQEASRVGTRATEADMARLDDSIAKAENVTFGGKSYTVEDLLSDDTVSSLISDYLNSAPGSEVRKRIDSTEPQLKDFIAKNEAALHDASVALQGGAKQFQDIQAANQALAQVGNQQLDPNLAKTLIPGFGTLQASNIDPASVPALAVTQNMSDQQKNAYAQELNTVASKDPNFGKELSSLSADEIRQLGIANNSPKWQNYKTLKEQSERVQNTDPSDVDSLVGQLFADAPDAQSVQKELNLTKAIAALGIGRPDKSLMDTLKAVDADGDGQIDDGQKIKDYLTSATAGANLKAILANRASPYTAPSIGLGDNTKLGVTDSTAQSLLSKIQGSLAQGTVSNQDLNKLNIDEALLLEGKADKVNMDGNALADRVSKLRYDTAESMWGDMINKVGGQETEDQLMALAGPVLQAFNAATSKYDPRLGVEGTAHLQEIYNHIQDKLNEIRAPRVAQEKAAQEKVQAAADKARQVQEIRAKMAELSRQATSKSRGASAYTEADRQKDAQTYQDLQKQLAALGG